MTVRQLTSHRDQLRRRVRGHLRQQRALIQVLLRQREHVRGSVFARYGRCGKPACSCRDGRGHGPYYVLSSRAAGHGAFTYLERGEAARARGLVRRHRDFRDGVRRLRRLNVELLALLRRYQAVLGQAGRRELDGHG